jgi:hypothetical protein
MSQDDFNKGQEDRSDSKDESTLDLVIGGGGSRHYDPPSDPDDKADYDEGWKNNH